LALNVVDDVVKVFEFLDSDVCLSGGAATAERTVALHALDSSDELTFLIVFSQDRSLRFKGVYTVELQRQRARKLFELPDANLPEIIEASDLSAYFKCVALFLLHCLKIPNLNDRFRAGTIRVPKPSAKFPEFANCRPRPTRAFSLVAANNNFCSNQLREGMQMINFAYKFIACQQNIGNGPT
jgi:hypothetical protein